MDVNLPLSKNQRHCEDVSIGDNSDRISQLPDEILVQILSHLPTKEAVATSILSKRWEYLWASTSNLDFSDSFLTSYENESDRNLNSLIFKQYVDRVIFYHGIGSSILQKCTMAFHTKCIARHIYSWICGVLSACNIKELELVDNSFTPQFLPLTLFNCKSLVVLKIKGNFVLDLPRYVCLPSLQDLNLSYVRLADDGSARRLLSSCPVLERLHIVRYGDTVRYVNISIPSLKSLIIDSEDYGCWFMINTPCLQYLFHRAVSCHTFVKQSSLIRGELDGKFNILLLSAMSQARALTLGKSCIQQLSIRNFETVPTFNNLRVLKCHVGCDFDWNVLLKFLKFTPKLWGLSFPGGLVRVRTDGLGFDRFNVNWNGAEFEPECLSLKVKIIYVNKLVGFEEEIQYVRYLLECCKVLKEMRIWRFDFRSKPRIENMVEWEWERIKSEILKFKRGSNKCEIVFVD